MGKGRASRRGTWGRKTELPGTPTMPETLENVLYSSATVTRARERTIGEHEHYYYFLALTSAASQHAQPRLR